MDELTLLRELEHDVPPLDAGAREAARRRLEAEMDRRRRHRGRPPAAKAAVGAAAVAAVAAGAIALTTDDQPARAPAAEPPAAHARWASAAYVLHRAAARTAQSRPAVIPRDDQYIYTKEIIEETPQGATRPDKTFVDENWRSVDGSKPSRISERGRTWTAPPLEKDESVWPPNRYADLEKLPTDPHRLLLWVRDFGHLHNTQRPMTDTDYDTAYMGLTFLLHGARVMPPGLQAAAFDALGEIPGVRVVDDDIDARGRVGLGISRPVAGNHLSSTLVIDRRTYDYLGMRDTLVRDNGEKVQQLTSLLASGVVDRIGQRP